jgi:hypothetical protein
MAVMFAAYRDALPVDIVLFMILLMADVIRFAPLLNTYHKTKRRASTVQQTVIHAHIKVAQSARQDLI